MPGGYSLPCQTSGFVEVHHVLILEALLNFGVIISKTSWQHWAALVPCPFPFSGRLRSIVRNVCQCCCDMARDNSCSRHKNKCHGLTTMMLCIESSFPLSQWKDQVWERHNGWSAWMTLILQWGKMGTGQQSWVLHSMQELKRVWKDFPTVEICHSHWCG
jgi:hypothetical protein